MEGHVRNVECPSCKRPWTGMFADDDKRDQVICKDCAAAEIAVRQAKK